MADWPGEQGNTPRARGWGDPDAPTRTVPRFPPPSAAPTHAPGTPPQPAARTALMGRAAGCWSRRGTGSTSAQCPDGANPAIRSCPDSHRLPRSAEPKAPPACQGNTEAMLERHP